MPAQPTLAAYIDEELMRAPLVAEQAIEATLEAIAHGAAAALPAERSVLGELSQTLRQQRTRMAVAYTQSLREQAQAFSRQADRRQQDPAGPVSRRGELELSLVDESAIASDIEISRTAELVKSACEYELREVGTFTAALAGDMDVAADHNPFGADVQSRALWAAAAVLATVQRVVFMRHAAAPLAQVLRKAYAAACRRLEDAGVEQAAHRTLILANPRAAGPGGGGPGLRTASDQTLRAIAEQLAADTAPTDPQRLELLSKLFEHVLTDRRLSRSTANMISRLQPTALRLALRDPQLFERHDHPFWRFVDAIATQAESMPEPPHPERLRALEHLEGVIDHLGGNPDPDAQLMRWAADRLLTYERMRLKRRIQAEAPRIERLVAADARAGGASADPGSSMAAPLDVGQLDTVPAELLDDHSGPADASPFVDALESGDLLRLFLRGGFITGQLLWRGPAGQVFLFVDVRSDDLCALDRGALMLLHAEGLAQHQAARSLVAEAIDVIASGSAMAARRG